MHQEDTTPNKPSAQQQAEWKAQQQAELLERVMNATLTAIVVHESVLNDAGEIIDFRLTQLNQMAADLLGGTIETIHNQLLSRYFPGVQQTFLFDKYRKVVQTGEPTRIELPLNGRWYDLSVTRFGDGLVVVVQEITHMRQYRQQLELANHELKRSNESLKSFAYIASHDLQEPLRKITSFADLLNTQHVDQVDEQTVDIIRRIRESAERMRLLIQDLLIYSQVETHQGAPEAVDLTRLIAELAEEDLWASLHTTKAQLHAEDLPTINAHPVQMRQLFQNLLTNAIKFGPKDQTPVVTVSSRRVNRADIPAGLLSPTLPGKPQSASDIFYEIAITDNGIGFDEKYAERIFQVFQRLHGKAEYPGSGIGLAICQKIVEHHRGAITARSELGQGSTFRVYIPA